MKEIPLTQEQKAIVDDGDYEWLNQWKWFARRDDCTYYAVRTIKTVGGKRQVSMHREILALTDPNTLCDHIDGNGLNNCKSNLRKVDKAINQINRGIGKNNTTGVTGVSLWKNRYQVSIQLSGKRKYLGLFDTLEEAAKARKKAEGEMFGEFARQPLPSPPRSVGDKNEQG